MLPFSRDEFLSLFAAYDEAVWPAQLLAVGMGLAVLVLILLGEDRYQRLIAGLVGSMWVWTGIVYHWLFFTEINPAAIAFGLLFSIQGLLFGLVAMQPELRLRFTLRAGSRTLGGAAMIGYALAGYPVIDMLTLNWPHSPAFGVTPCPLAMFTLGLMLLAEPRPPWWLWIGPLAWSLIGGTASFLLGVPQDWPLLVAGPAAVWLAFHQRPREASA